jgi:hypothetical protein
LWNAHGDRPKDRDARLVHHMIELTRDLGGAIEQISTAKYLLNTIDNTFTVSTENKSKPRPNRNRK